MMMSRTRMAIAIFLAFCSGSMASLKEESPTAAGSLRKPSLEMPDDMETDERVIKTMKQVELWQKQHEKRQLQGASLFSFTIPVFAHIILKSDGQTDGPALVTEQSLGLEIDRLNALFLETDTPFQFELQLPLHRTISSRWHDCLKTDNDKSMRMALHKGNTESLNIYFCDTSGSQYHGWSSFPWWLDTADSSNEHHPDEDGITVGYNVVENAENYNARLLAHEIGHFLGLHHTYKNACTFPGDGVRDTPAQISASFICSGYRNTCTDDQPDLVDPGPDPVYNVMNGAPASCRREFTTGQITQMIAMHEQYRTGTASLSVAGSLAPPPSCTTAGLQCSGHGDCCEGLACLGGVCLTKLKLEDAVRFSARNKLKEDIAIAGGRRRKPGN